jgi:hypothetical protein
MRNCVEAAMLAGQLALMTAAAFTGAAIYINVKLPRPEGRGFGASLTALPIPRRSDS